MNNIFSKLETFKRHNREFLLQQGYTEQEVTNIRSMKKLNEMLDEANTRMFLKVAKR